MRWLLWAVLIAAAAWSGLWFAGARTLDGAVADALSSAAPNVAVQAHSVAGFPNRFDLTLTEPRLTDPVSGIAWSAAFVQVFALSYRPWHTIFALPTEQRLDWPEGGLVLRAKKLQASLVLRPTQALPLDRLIVVGDGLEVRPDFGAGARVASVHFATRLDPTRLNAHQIGLEVSGIAPDAVVLATLPQGSDLPAVTDTLRLDAIASFSAPLDRFAAETLPLLTQFDLTALSFRWGEIALEGEGALSPDANGFAEGRIALRLDHWRKAIDAAVALGALRAEIAPTWAEFARRLAEAGGNPDRLELPLIFAGGRMSLGPIPLGPAPRLVP
jgi:hypothetical protein